MLFYTRIPKFEWSAACDDAFLKCKQELMKNTVLVHYDRSKEIYLFKTLFPEGNPISCKLIFPGALEKL